MIHVLVIHEYRLMCNIILAALKDEPDLEMVGFATTVTDAIELIQHETVDVALVSSRLPDQGAFQLTHELSQLSPDTKVLILGITEARGHVIQYIEAGAKGYVLRDNSFEDLLQAIRTADKGLALVSPQIAAAMMSRLTNIAQTLDHSGTTIPESIGLTRRQMAVLELLAQNKSNQQIAEELFLGIGTVKNHVHNILVKIGVNSRLEAANFYLRHQNRL